MTIEEKYKKLRGNIPDGAIILFKGKGLMPTLIGYFDDAYWTHAGVAFWSNGRLMVLDSNARGVKPDFMSVRIGEYYDISVLSIRKNKSVIKWGMEYIFQEAEKGIKYDFLTLVRIAAKRKFAVDLKNLGSEDRDVCSEFARRLTMVCGVKCYSKAIRGLESFISPQDFVRFLSLEEIEEIK